MLGFMDLGPQGREVSKRCSHADDAGQSEGKDDEEEEDWDEVVSIGSDSTGNDSDRAILDLRPPQVTTALGKAFQTRLRLGTCVKGLRSLRLSGRVGGHLYHILRSGACKVCEMRDAGSTFRRRP